MTLYAPSREPDLAQAIHDRLYPFLRDTAPEGVETFRDFGLDNFASGVLFKCDMPAAMMEPLFMSHPAEAELLVQRIFGSPEDGDPEDGCAAFSCRRGQIALAIHDGVLNYYDSGLMHVASMTLWDQLRGSSFFIYTQVAIHDQEEAPVPGATVEIETSLPDGSTVLSTGITGEDGTVTFKVRSDQAGPYISTVLDVSKEGWEYDPTGSGELDETLTVP